MNVVKKFQHRYILYTNNYATIDWAPVLNNLVYLHTCLHQTVQCTVSQGFLQTQKYIYSTLDEQNSLEAFTQSLPVVVCW